MERNKARLVELLKDNELCKECGNNRASQDDGCRFGKEDNPCSEQNPFGYKRDDERNEVGRCTGCGAYLSLWSEAEMLASRGVFCPPVVIGTEIFIVFDDYDPAFGEPVFLGSEKIVDVSTRGFWFELSQEGAPVDFYPWEELEKKDMFFLDKGEAEERYKELMKKYE